MPRRRSRFVPLLLLLATAALGCAAADVPASTAGGPAPVAEFLVTTGDTALWVRSGPGGVRVRGAPLLLQRLGGRFHELYVVDDDRSYYDAVLVGQRMYRRDLVTGDSLLVFEDTLVPAFTRLYAAAHPAEWPLRPDEEASESPSLTVLSEVEPLEVVGPYLTYEYHAHVRAAAEGEELLTRHGVVDLRDGRRVTLEALVGRAEAERLAARGRRMLAEAMDSLLAEPDSLAERAAGVLADFHFDSSSFGLVRAGPRAAVAFVVPGRGGAAGGLTLELAPIPLDGDAEWMREGEGAPAAVSEDSARWRWERPGLALVGEADHAAQVFTLVLRDSTRSWPIATLPAPVRGIFWLDEPAADSTTRRGLLRAFDEAALYSESARAVSGPRPPPRARAIPIHHALPWNPELPAPRRPRSPTS